jgi:hypothetical protein
MTTVTQFIQKTNAAEQVAAYAAALFEPDDVVEVRRLPSGVSAWQRADELAGETDELARQNANGINIHVGANPRLLSGAKRDAGVALARCVFADFDGVVDFAADVALRIVGADLPEPTVTLNSGHGVHCYWRLIDAITDLVEWSEIQKNLAALLGSDPKICNPERIMRLPGFRNHKPPPAPCELIDCVPDRRYEWCAILSRIPKRAAEVSTSSPAPAVGDAINNGERNSMLTSLAGTMRRRGMNENAITAALLIENRSKCRPPLPDDEVRAISRSVSRYAPAADETPLVIDARVTDQWHPFPLDALPPVMERFAGELARSLCVDPVMAVLPMLSVAGAAIGNAARARMSADYHAPANVWSAAVVRSGERKSPVLRAVMAPIYSRQHERAEQHTQAVAAYQEEMEEWKAKPKNERGDPPMDPGPYPHLYLQDTTTEAIASRLSQQPRGLAVVLDELAAFFTSMNQYRSKGGSDRETYLAFYDAGPAKIDRKSASPPTLFIPRAFIAVTGMIQPGVLARALGPAEFNSGLAARFLLASPPPMMATWSDGGIGEGPRDGWRDLLYALLDRPVPEQPALIPPSDAAMRFWSKAHDRLEAERHHECDDHMRAARAKLIGAIPRLALILQCVSAAGGEKSATFCCIDEMSMRRGIELVEWFTQETRRIYGLLIEGSDEDNILARIEANGGIVTVRELMHWTRAGFRTAAAAESYLDSLARDGAGRWGWAQQQGRGRPRRVFALFKPGDSKHGHTNTAGAIENGNCVPVFSGNGDSRGGERGTCPPGQDTGSEQG